MTSGVVLKMNAFVRVTEGMRVLYDCPPPLSGDYGDSDKFFKKYRGRTGTIVEFLRKFVGPLDWQGRLPGIYYRTDCVDVRFDGEDEVHRGLNLLHFTLNDTGMTVLSEISTLTQQKVYDLPDPIEFWPGDEVRKVNDPSKTIYFVENLRIEDSGTIIYIIATGKSTLVANDRYKSNQLMLNRRGHVYHLYHDLNDMLTFSSLEEEAIFWGKEGISCIVPNTSSGNLEMTLRAAVQMIEDDDGDLILTDHSGRPGTYRYRVCKLHECFKHYRARVRELTMRIVAEENSLRAI